MIRHLGTCTKLIWPDRLACNCGADALAVKRAIAPTPPANTPLRAAARMLRRLAARATHHDAARHLLATAGDAVEPPVEDGANAATH